MLDAAQLYLQYIINDYHPNILLAVLTAILLGWAMVKLPAMRPAGWGILAVLVLAIALLLLHPNQKARFLHSWLAIVWMVGGVGIGTIVSMRWPRFVKVAFIGTAISLPAFGLYQSNSTTRMMVDQQPGNSLLQLSDWYLSEVGPDDSVAIISTQPDINFFKWTYRERFGEGNRLEKDSWLWWPITDSQSMAEGFQAWLSRTKVDHVVVIDVSPESSQFRAVQHPYATYSALPELMESQGRFERRNQTTLDGCRASIWRRTDLARNPQPPRR